MLKARSLAALQELCWYSFHAWPSTVWGGLPSCRKVLSSRKAFPMKKKSTSAFPLFAALCKRYAALPVPMQATLLTTLTITKLGGLAFLTDKLILLHLSYPIAFLVAGLVYYHHFRQSKYVFIPLGLWAARLAIFLAGRLWWLGDWRYTPEAKAMLFPNGYLSYINWYLATCVATFGVSSVLYFCFKNEVKGMRRNLPLALILAAILGESLADYQLTRFRLSHEVSDVCQTGLWAISRHPNYLFDLLIWVGFAWLGGSWYGLGSPAVLAGVLWCTSIPLQEEHCRKVKEGYEDYCQSVGRLFPCLVLGTPAASDTSRASAPEQTSETGISKKSLDIENA